ncbi:MAG: HigA family addiction module antidote protein [Candidatus Thiodiazotropha sp. (ex Lucinoma kastoroae)]|nr:HigA family addiction module antidote protein [Candidatus Thiodiazotropha sp. (ex Rostrolucina anterorostrata)]MCU7848246.1 HigA family addiction module antidote protein [Candidatus Thiodiazotropha sp. (ex Lucinoma kastoroae)]
MQQHNPMHPGEFIRRVYLIPFKIGSNELARKLQVSAGLVSRLLNGKTDLSPAMALKLSKVLGRSAESWLLMQDNFDLWQVRQEIDLNSFDPISFCSLNHRPHNDS